MMWRYWLRNKLECNRYESSLHDDDNDSRCMQQLALQPLSSERPRLLLPVVGIGVGGGLVECW